MCSCSGRVTRRDEANRAVEARVQPFAVLGSVELLPSEPGFLPQPRRLVSVH